MKTYNACNVWGFGGHHMERTFTKYDELPVGEDALKAAGWVKHGDGSCDPHLGFARTEDASGTTVKQPMKLYTTAGGQPEGVGIVIRDYKGQAALPEPQKQWATEHPLVEPKRDPNVVHIDVAFRSGAMVCSGAKEDAAVGGTLIVNPAGTSKTLPLTEAESESQGWRQGWRQGSWFDGMGYHRFLDTSMGNNKLSWEAKNLFPVVTMFHKGVTNAIFFASTINQVTVPMFQHNE